MAEAIGWYEIFVAQFGAQPKCVILGIILAKRHAFKEQEADFSFVNINTSTTKQTLKLSSQS